MGGVEAREDGMMFLVCGLVGIFKFYDDNLIINFEVLYTFDLTPNPSPTGRDESLKGLPAYCTLWAQSDLQNINKKSRPRWSGIC